MKQNPATAPKVASKNATGEKKNSREELKKKSLSSAAKDAKDEQKERDTIYLYPVDVKTKAEKKAHRRQLRAELKKFNKQLSALKSSKEPSAKGEIKTLTAKFEAWKKENLSAIHPEMVG